MAVQVWQPEKKKDTAGGAFQTIGGIASMIPHPAAKAVGMGLQYAGSQPDPSAQAEKPMAPEQAAVPQDLAMPDRSGAISRRSQFIEEDPQAGILDAREALLALDLDPEVKDRLLKPLDMALKAQRSIG
jgi:hypothetical protein